MNPFHLAALVLPICIAASGFTGALGSPESRLSFASSRVEGIAKALRRYRSDSAGALPKGLKDLCPKYVANESELWITEGEPSAITGCVTICYVPGNPIPNPDVPGQSMIAFTAAEIGGGRFVVDSELRVWFVGEVRFQHWLAGIAVLRGRDGQRPDIP